jgi:hypothetical protein
MTWLFEFVAEVVFDALTSWFVFGDHRETRPIKTYVVRTLLVIVAVGVIVLIIVLLSWR